MLLEEEEVEHGEVADDGCGKAHEARQAWSSSSSSWCGGQARPSSPSCAAAQSSTERSFLEEEKDADKEEEELDAVTLAETIACSSLSCCCNKCSRRAVAVHVATVVVRLSVLGVCAGVGVAGSGWGGVWQEVCCGRRVL